MLTINSRNYSSSINANWSNVEFVYPDGAGIPAWIESGANNTSNDTVVWLNLTTQIAGGKSLTIYMVFFPTTDHILYPVGTVGEAPTLSPVYGQHDDGANVFLVYGAFQGTSMPSDWTAHAIYSGYTPAFNGGTSPTGGVEMMNNVGWQATALEYGHTFTKTGVLMEASWSYGSNTDPNTFADDMGFGAYAYSVNYGAGGNTPSAAFGYYASYEFYEGGLSGISYDGGIDKQPTTQTMPDNNAGPYFAFSQTSLANSNIQMNLVTSTSGIFETGQYTGFQTILSYDPTSLSTTYGLLYVGSATGGTESFQYLYWLRVRAIPPGNVMPAVKFGNPFLAGAVAPSTSAIDSGQSALLNINGVSGGLPPYTYQWYQFPSPSPMCITTNPLPGANHSSLLTTPTSNSYYCYSVTDSLGFTLNSIPGLVTISGPLVAGVITPANSSIDVHQLVTLTSHPSGGTPPYINYQWYSGTYGSCGWDTAIPGANTPIYNATPASNTTYCYSVEDSSPGIYTANVSSATHLIVVQPDPIVTAPQPDKASIDVKQSVSFTTEGQLGSGTYTSYSWTSQAGLNCTASTSSSIACDPSQSGTFNISVNVTDSLGYASQDNSSTYVVYPALVAAAPVPSKTNVLLGERVSFNETPINPGSGGDVYLWTNSSGALGCATSSSSRLNCTPIATGTYTVSVTVADSNGESGSAQSEQVTVSKGTAPASLASVSISPTQYTVMTGDSISFTASPTCTPGACPSGVLYTWNLSKALGSVSPAQGTSPTTKFTAGSSTGTTVLTVSARLNGTSKTASADVTITSTQAPTLVSVSVYPTTVQVQVNHSQVFNATAMCSSSPCPAGGVSYAWSLSNGSAGSLNVTTGQYVSFTAGSSRTNITLTVRATLNGKSVDATSAITITPLAGSLGTSKNPFIVLFSSSDFLLLLLLAVIVVLIIVAIIRRRRRKSSHQVPSPEVGAAAVPAGVAPIASGSAAPGTEGAGAPPKAEWSEDDEMPRPTQSSPTSTGAVAPPPPPSDTPEPEGNVPPPEPWDEGAKEPSPKEAAPPPPPEPKKGPSETPSEGRRPKIRGKKTKKAK
jgi:hypothetical protein